MNRIWLKAMLLLVGSAAQAQQSSDYADMRSREIKALSSQQIHDLRDGRGMGFSLAAELNSTPGPLHVLELRDALGVTAPQIRELERIMASMKAEARALGNEIVDAERVLNSGFANGTLDEAAIQQLTQRIAVLNGQLRAAHLKAHLKTKRLVTPAQVIAYDEKRGYMLGAPDTLPRANQPTKSHH